VSVAGFGYDDGETSWLENRGGWSFEPHVLQRLSGPINAIPTDLDGNKTPDIVALVSQEWEEIWAFVGNGRGQFTPKLLWGSTNPDFGSSWMTIVDLDRDNDPDILYANGDAFEYAPPNSRPWQGVQWLRTPAVCGLRCTGSSISRARPVRRPLTSMATVTSISCWSSPTAIGTIRRRPACCGSRTMAA
jgi:hypothetical protein